MSLLAALRRFRPASTTLALAIVAPTLALLASSAAPAGAAPGFVATDDPHYTTVAYSFEGAERTFVVPDGVTELVVEATGGAGGAINPGVVDPNSGRGARVTGTVEVDPGQELYVRVGGAGATSTSGGWNGGGDGSYGSVHSGSGGGGATDVRTCAEGAGDCDQLASRLLVAAGGGGGGGAFCGSCPDTRTAIVGGSAGASGAGIDQGRGPVAGGAPGAADAGGAGGLSVSEFDKVADGVAGGFGAGGSGTGCCGRYGGGGGGGGWYGGGSGGVNTWYSAGGGGGSNLVPAGGTSSLVGRSVPAGLTISYDLGPITDVSVAGPAAPLVATGQDTATVQATATTSDGTAIPGLDLRFTSSDPGQQFGPVTDHGDGTYSATITGSTTVGTATVTATAAGSTTGADVSGTVVVETEGYTVTVTAEERTMVATGHDSLSVTATAESASGVPLDGLDVGFHSSDVDQSFGSVQDHGDGTYTATLHGSATVGTATVTWVVAGGGSPTVVSAVVETEGYTVEVKAEERTMVATGHDSLAVTATAESASGVLLDGLDVGFDSTDEGQSFGSVQDQGDGTYTATLRGSATAGPATVTAAVTDGGSPDVVGADVETEGYTVTVKAEERTMVATGRDSLTVTATAESESGVPLDELDLDFTSTDAGHSFGSVEGDEDGTYTATLQGSTTIGTATIAAEVTDGGNPDVDPDVVVTEGYAVTVTAEARTMVATGRDSLRVTATAESASGVLLEGLDVSFESDDEGQSFGSVEDHGDGTYSATLSGSTTVGTASIKAVVTDGGSPEVVGAPVETEEYSVTVLPMGEHLLGTGVATRTVTARAQSTGGKPVRGLVVAFASTDPGHAFGPVTAHEDGTYTATLTGSATAGTASIKATVTGAGSPTVVGADLVTDEYVKPVLTAAIGSGTPASAGWYRAPVTVTFACAGSLPLTTACPAPVVLGTDGRSQQVSRSVTDTLGSVGSVTSAAVNIDTTAPVVRVTGAKKGATYPKARKLACKATDGLSGVASCKVTTKKAKGKKGKSGKRTRVVRWTATAVDVAGNSATTVGSYKVRKRVTRR